MNCGIPKPHSNALSLKRRQARDKFGTKSPFLKTMAEESFESSNASSRENIKRLHNFADASRMANN